MKLDMHFSHVSARRSLSRRHRRHELACREGWHRSRYEDSGSGLQHGRRLRRCRQRSMGAASPDFHSGEKRTLAEARENIEKDGLADRLQVVQASAFEPPSRMPPSTLLSMRLCSRCSQATAHQALSSMRGYSSPRVLLTQDVCFRCDDAAEQKELRAGLSRAINVNVEPLTRACWKERIESHGFATEQKAGAMTLMIRRQ